MNYLSSSDCNRVYLPPLRGKLLSDCKNIIKNMNSALTRFCISSLSELCNLCYCAAHVVTEECGVSDYEGVNKILVTFMNCRMVDCYPSTKLIS